jgi:hypothetical protein
MDQAAVYVDSGCTKSIFGNPFKLINLRRPDCEYYVKGIAGQVRVTEMGDFPLAIRADDGKTHIIVIKNCLVTPEANMNLLATCDLQKAGVSFCTTAHSKAAMLELEKDNKKVVFDLTFDHCLYKLPFYQDVATHFAGAFSHQLRALTEHELWHRRLGPLAQRRSPSSARDAKASANRSQSTNWYATSAKRQRPSAPTTLQSQRTDTTGTAHGRRTRWIWAKGLLQTQATAT